jgi:dihydrofolate reductase
MKNIQLFIAVTLDGFIAREDGSLDWLLEMPNPNNLDHGYNDFIAKVDLIIMGRKTYEVVLDLDMGWPYSNCKTYVATKDKEYKVKTDHTYIVYELDKDTIERFRSESQMNIWLVGGGELITLFLNEEAIDEMTISVIPIILGKGIRLFPDTPKETRLELVGSESFETGVVNLVYRRKI